MLPFGPEPVKIFAEGWFALAAAQNPKPKTVAIGELIYPYAEARK
jgi:hypothetical protein